MIALIDCGIANISSVEKALKKISQQYFIANKSEDLEKATHIILPGVGAFEEGMKRLKEKNFIEAIKKEVLENKKPILGVCLGMQLLFSGSEEGETPVKGLGLIKGEVKKFKFSEDKKLKIPHIGWNEVFFKGEIPKIFDGIEKNSCFYFLHSYHATSDEENICKAFTNYGYDFISAIQKENIFGVQFHPEKSQKKGLKLLKNFCEIKC